MREEVDTMNGDYSLEQHTLLCDSQNTEIRSQKFKVLAILGFEKLTCRKLSEGRDISALFILIHNTYLVQYLAHSTCSENIC